MTLGAVFDGLKASGLPNVEFSMFGADQGCDGTEKVGRLRFSPWAGCDAGELSAPPWLFWPLPVDQDDRLSRAKG